MGYFWFLCVGIFVVHVVFCLLLQETVCPSIHWVMERFLNLKMFLVDTYTIHMSYFLSHWYPCFGLSGDVSSGFRCHSGFCIIHIYEGECKVHSRRSTSGATPANHLMASIAAGCFPTWWYNLLILPRHSHGAVHPTSNSACEVISSFMYFNFTIQKRGFDGMTKIVSVCLSVFCVVNK